MILELRKDKFDLRFGMKNLTRFLIPALLIFIFANQISAQPGGCYSYVWKTEYCREERTTLLNNLKKRLSELDEKISREPKNAALYYERGRFYTSIMYEIGLGFKNVEFDGKVYFSDVDAKAVADLTRAINLSPKSEYYENRGRIYASYWETETSRWFQDSFGKTAASNREIFEKIDKLFLDNANFKQAESDFLKSIDSGSNDASDVSQGRLKGLRELRAYRLAEFEPIAKLIGSTKIADVALADSDFVIEYIKNQIKKGYMGALSIQSSLLSKAEIAKKFGRDEIALKTLDEAVATLDAPNSEVCNVYARRADIYLKRQKVDLAIRDISSALEKSPYNCRRMSEFRGDIYRRNGEIDKAIDDYTTYLDLDKENPFLYSALYWKRGELFLQIKDYEKALADFTASIGSGSICVDDYLRRAKIYRLLGNEKAALADEKEAQRRSEIIKDDKSSYCRHLEEQ